MSEDTILVAVVNADVDQLRQAGFDLAPTLTTEHLAQRIGSYAADWNAEGGFYDRTVEVIDVFWDPADRATASTACGEATVDNEVLVVIAAASIASQAVPCIVVAGDTPLILSSSVGEDLIAEAPDRLFTLAPTTEDLVAAAIDYEIASSDLPTDKPIGVLVDNTALGLAIRSEVEKVEAERSMKAIIVEISGTGADLAAVNRDAAASVDAFSQAGVSHVFNALDFTRSDGFYSAISERNPSWGLSQLDGGAGTCTAYSASKVPADAIGIDCVTSSFPYTTVGGEIRSDTPFEAECRRHWVELFGDTFNDRSDPGVPSGEILELDDGEVLYSDYDYPSCTIAHLLEAGLEAAGPDLTRDSFASALKTIDDVPVAGASMGVGSFNDGTNTYTEWVIPVRLAPADGMRTRSTDGTFNTCPAPVNCWVPTSDEWIKLD